MEYKLEARKIELVDKLRCAGGQAVVTTLHCG